MNVNMTLILQMLPLLIIIVLAVVGVMSIKKNQGTKDKSSNDHPTNWRLEKKLVLNLFSKHHIHA